MQDIAIDHSTAQGWPMERYLRCGSSWYVKSHYIEYLSPALLGHEILIAPCTLGMTERSSPRRTLFLRADDRRILARAETQWIFVSLRNGRPVSIPDELRAVFNIVESEDESCDAWNPCCQLNATNWLTEPALRNALSCTPTLLCRVPSAPCAW